MTKKLTFKNIDQTEILKGELITLRPLRPEDFDALFEVGSDPLIWEQHPEKNRYEKDAFRKFFDGAFGAIGPYVSFGALAVIDNKTSKIIGSSRYYDYDPETNCVFVGYSFLAREFWGGEYNKEMKRLMMEHAFRYVDSVLFHIGEHNQRSQRAIEKIGAKVLEKKIVNGSMHFVYGIDRPQG